jgi:hypothetical protein
MLDCVWNVMAHAQKPDFVFRRNGRVHLNQRGRQFSRLLAAEVCASAVVMLDTPCSEVVWRVLANHSIRLFPLHYPSRTSPCAVTFQLNSTLKDYPYSLSSQNLRFEGAALVLKRGNFTCDERLAGRGQRRGCTFGWQFTCSGRRPSECRSILQLS